MEYCDDDDFDLELVGLDDRWRDVFAEFDANGFGEMPSDRLSDLLKEGHLRGLIEEDHARHVEERVTASGRHRSDSSPIRFEQFVELLTRKRSNSFKCAVHVRDRQVRYLGTRM